jgi:glycosyltransferase involved in cell wall biosynthesis
MSKVALLQNYLGLDGRSRTLLSVIELLNQRGIVPDVHSFSGAADEQRFRSLALAPLSFHLRSLARPRFLLGDLLQELAVPYLFRRRLQGYDLVFTNATASYGYPPDLPLLRLVCFPLERVRKYEARYKEPAFRAYGWLCAALYQIASKDCDFHGRWLANSRFTRRVMAQTYPVKEDDIEVVYAPVVTRGADSTGERSRSVVSIGGFHADKRQLEQIEIARRLPDAQFTLIGSARSRSYFNRCVEAAKGLDNVQLLPNASNQQIEASLLDAKVFLHSKRFEHFGISSIEGIAQGCVPVVHDSGGQQEAVPFDELRYRNLGEATAKVRQALDGDFDEMLPHLQSHIQAFSDECFKERMSCLLDEMGIKAPTSAVNGSTVKGLRSLAIETDRLAQTQGVDGS